MTCVLSSRKKHEQESVWSPYQTDVERILHSNAYARYADKTQVVYLLYHDHIAYRGLHVQLVSALARAIGQQLSLNLDLIEAISLGHDLGHAPFGHEGEKYLDYISQQEGLGPFAHARQSCRVVDEIEPMNLTLATLHGFLCHDGGLSQRIHTVSSKKNWDDYEQEVACANAYLAPATKEAALVKLCDTISYLERDLEDALTLGIISHQDIPMSLFRSGSQIMTQTLALDIVNVYMQTGNIGLSEHMFEQVQKIRLFNYENIYFNSMLKMESEKIQKAYNLLFNKLFFDWKNNGKNSFLWTHFLHNKSNLYVSKYCASQHVIDYIAGMTDGYFLRLFHELYVPNTIKMRNV